MLISFKRNTYRILAVFLVPFLFFSCSTHYRLAKSHRAEYSISSQVPVDSAVINTYLPYKKTLDVEMNKVVATTAVTLTKSSESPETLMGNFFADAVLTEALKIDPEIDFAIPTTNGGLRCDWQKGPVTLSKVYELMPFENEIMVYKLSGADVEDLLNYIANIGGEPVSRLRMKITNGKPADVMINGIPFDKKKTYWVMTSDYIGQGGDNVNSFKKSLEAKVLGLKIRDAILNNITILQAAGTTINAKLDGRITKN